MPARRGQSKRYLRITAGGGRARPRSPARRHQDRELERGVAEVDGRRPGCERCLRLEEELRDLRLRFAASGQYVAFSPGPNPKPNVDDELGRWLATNLAQMQLLG